MSIRIYFEVKVAMDFLKTIPNSSEISSSRLYFYLLPKNSDSTNAWSKSLATVYLYKEGGKVTFSESGSGLPYGTYTDLTLEQDETGVYLYKTNSTKPDVPGVYAVTYSTNNALWASKKCDLEYITETACRCTIYIVPTTITVNVITQYYPSNLLNGLPSRAYSASSTTSIYVDNKYILTHRLDSASKLDTTTVFTLTSNITNSGVPYVIDRDENEVYIHRANLPASSNYSYRLSGTIATYISVDRLEIEYVSDTEANIYIYYTNSHGKVVSYYALYEYTMLVPNDPAFDESEDEEEEDESEVGT
jgi:hypothetical protein